MCVKEILCPVTNADDADDANVGALFVLHLLVKHEHLNMLENALLGDSLISNSVKRNLIRRQFFMS